MAAAVQALPGTAGSRQGASLTTELSQYDKIIALRDEVFAGKHPRLRLPSATAAAAPASNVAHPNPWQASSSSALPNGLPPRPPPSHKPAVASASRAEQTSAFTNGASSALPVQHPVPPPVRHSPKLDPIFLTKSDGLIREEMKLERRRIELALENQLHQKKVQSKRNAEPDIAPDFDLSEVLQQAQELVKHLPAHVAPAANRVGSHSDSVDEATYYSSQVNETSTDDSGDRSKRKTTKPCKFFFEGSCRKGDACSFSHDPAFRQKLQGLAAEADHSEFESDPNRMGQHGRNANGGRLRPSPTYSNRESGELIEDSPYSPSLQMHVEDPRPEPNMPRGEAGRDNFAGRNNHNNRRQSRRSPPPGDRRARASPDMRDGKVVRNHITSPLAPQPSRVSPLAVAKVPRVDRLRHEQHEERSPRQGRQANSNHQSPAGPPQGRKRRREVDIDDVPRNVAPRRFMESPPPPEIKEEPLSPVPFQDLPAQRYAVQDEVARVPVEYVSTPRQREHVVYHPVPPDDRDFLPSEFRRGTPQSSRRVFSGPEAPCEPMNGHPVRRVVTTSRYPERFASPVQSVRDYPPPPSATFQPPTGEMTPHLAPMDTRSYRGSVQPQQMAHSVPHEPTSPEIRRVQYSPIERRGSVVMAPPRRIVMDQDGNRYYEAVRPEPMPPTVRDPYYAGQLISSQEVPQRVASVRPQTARVVSDGRYVQRVASPPVRYVEYRPSTHALPPQPVYEPPERAYRGSRGEIVHLVQYPPERREIRYSDVGRPQEIVRLSSVAPREPPAYDVAPPPEMARMPSVPPRDGGPEPARSRMPHAATAQPDAPPRIVELGRQSVVNYPREVRELSARPQERYARHEPYVEAPRARYRYVSDMPPADYDLREMDGGAVMEGAKENQRPIQRL